MIEPAAHGPALLDDIRAADPGPVGVCVWWLGQSGFLLRSRTSTVLIDPYLSESLTVKYAQTDRPHVRMTRSPLQPADLTGVDVVLASHKHSDHLDPGTIPDLLRASPSARLVVPRSLLAHARTLSRVEPERVVGIDAGESRRMAGCVVHAVASAHEGLDTDADGHHLYLGYVVEIGGVSVYHSGDSLAYDDLAARLTAVAAPGSGRLDVLFLPINGRDPARGVPGNMTAAEAVALARAVRPRFVVPHHYDMFTFNTVPVSRFEAAARDLEPGIQPVVLRCGARWEVRR